MHKSRIWIAIIIYFAAIWGFKANPKGNEVDIFVWSASYYMTNDLTRFEEYWGDTVVLGAFDAPPRVLGNTVGFLSQIFRQNPDLLRVKIHSIKQFPESQRNPVRLLLWWVNTDQAQELLKQNGDLEMAMEHPPQINNKAIISVTDISFCIGYFYATGDVDAIRPLLRYCETMDLDSEDERNAVVIGDLKALCKSDCRVKTLVNTHLKKKGLGEDARIALLVILDRLDEVKSAMEIRGGGQNGPAAKQPRRPAERMKGSSE